MWYNVFIGGRGWAWVSSSSPGRAAIVGGRKPPSAYNKGGITMGVFTAATAYMVLGAFLFLCGWIANDVITGRKGEDEDQD